MNSELAVLITDTCISNFLIARMQRTTEIYGSKFSGCQHFTFTEFYHNMFSLSCAQQYY